MVEVPCCPFCSRMPASRIEVGASRDRMSIEQSVVWVCANRKCLSFMEKVEPKWFLIRGKELDGVRTLPERRGRR